MLPLARYGRALVTTLIALATSALVVVGLLAGACTSSRPAGYCFRPGICYHSSPTGESLFECPHGEAFEEGTCPATLRVGACVTPPNIANHAIYLYAPLHGILPPDCVSIAGQGAYYVRD